MKIHYGKYKNHDGVDIRPLPDIIRELRHKRERLLAAFDWTQLPDVPLETKEAWATYRQALRDITEQPCYPLDVVWPEPPSPAP